VLDRAGYEAFPARSVGDADALVADGKITLRLLIVGGVPANAATFVTNLRGRYKDLRVLCLVDDLDATVEPVPGVDMEWPRPKGRGNADQAELLLVIERMLALETVRSEGAQVRQ
jgi:hypothetical protein